MSEQPIELHPEARRLMEQIALLREELVRLLTQWDELIEVVRPNLFALYEMKIGLWELRAFEAKFQVARLKRKIELVQAALNRGQRPDWAAIETELEREHQLWQVKLRELQERIDAAEKRMKNLLSTEEAQELKKLYRSLAKRLHPDVNPNLTNEQRRLWLRIQSAFAAGDLAEMQALALLAETAGAAPPTATALQELNDARETLVRQIGAMLERIESIESEPPFTFRDLLKDDAWVEKRRAELEAEIHQLQAYRLRLESHLQQLAAQSDAGPQFSKN